MAEPTKEATVYVVDLGETTGECHSGRVQTDLDYGMTYIWEKIAITMGRSLKSLSAGVVGLRTDKTDNPLAVEGEYENISILKPLGPLVINDLSELKRKIVPSETIAGDAVSAIVLAVHMITEFTTLKSGKPGKYARKIVLLTDGQGSIDDSQNESIATQINECEISLVVIGIDFDDKEFGFKEEDKSSIKQRNEVILRRLTESCANGLYATAAEAIENLDIPDVKSSRPYTTFEGRLALGDPEKYENTALFIDVRRVFKTHLAKPASASSFVAKAPIGSTQSSHTLNEDVEMTDAPADGGDLSAVNSTFTYTVNDPTAPLGRRDVQREDLAKGYLYGGTAVPISDADRNVTDFESFKGFSIIGFIPNDKHERFLNMGEAGITVAQQANPKARMAFSSLVHALHELDSYAVARIVPKDGKPPQLILMAPSIEPDLEALIDIPLPFAEDVRVYRFPPLDKVVTATGSTLKKHRYLPDEDLVAAMSNYVDTMDLSTAGQGEEGEPAEYLKLDEQDYPACAPMIHRLNRAIRQRAIHPEDPVSEPATILTQWSYPPPDIVSKSASQLEKLIGAAHVQKVPPKVKGTRFRRDVIKPLSGLDVNALLSREKRQKLSHENTIPEFKQMLESPPDDNAVYDATKQMAEVIFKLVSSSVGGTRDPEAVADMRVFKEYMIDYEMPEVWNEFIQDFKARVVRGELGGDRRDFWGSLKGYKLGLIDKSVLEISAVTEKEAQEFFLLKETNGKA